MMSSNFARLPSVSITRSRFLRKSQHKTSLKLGEITPIYLDEVLPGDTRSVDIGSLIRMSNPVAPVMDNIYLDVYAFFVPNRLVWEHWKEFMGENNSSAGIYSGTEYKIPSTSVVGIPVGSVGDHFGLPAGIAGTNTKVSVLPIRGMRRIYNRFFRDQNLIAPLVVSTGDTATSNDSYQASLLKAAKISDYFTRSLPYAQKGVPVTIPLGTSAPVFTGSLNPNLVANISSTTDNVWELKSKYPAMLFGVKDKSYTTDKFNAIGMRSSTDATLKGGALAKGSNAESIDDMMFGAAPVNLYADLSTATAATINQLRFAFQYQKLLEKDALYGTRYWEIIKAHFGVTAPDASLQDPELLGHRKIYINVDQVVQTTGINQASPSQNELGQTGAVSVTADAGSIFTKSFTEHGYIHIYVVARHDQTYGQGIERHWSRSSRTDFYFPVFANLGAQNVLRKEIYALGTTANDETIFGYQEAWAEYRYKPSKVTGILNPSRPNSLGYWTLSTNFSGAPTLSQSFIEQDRDALARVLQTGSNGPDFIADFAFRDIAVRPMPLYSIPGLIDHH